MAAKTFNFYADQLFFAKKVAVLMKATSDDDVPIPGYLYQEINNISLESPAHCEFLLQFLVKRMSKPSCHVKFKTLKLMKHVVENGNPAFKAGLQRSYQCVQEATKFSGTPDPSHGMVPYQVVRQTAKELCQILFDAGLSPKEQSPSPESQQRMVGMGPSAAGTGGKYQGFGNSPVTKKSLTETIRDKLDELADTFDESPAKRQAEILAKMQETPSEYQPPVVPIPEPSPSQTREMPAPKVIPKHIPGRAGGGWDDDLDTSQGQGSGTQSEGSGFQSDRDDTAPQTDWSAEEQLVKDYLFLNDQSQFFLLRPSQLKEFKKKVQMLNCEKVIDIINKWMHSTDDYVIGRSLLLLEPFLVRNDTVSLDYVVTSCGQHLVHLYNNSTDSRIQNKAGKIVKGLEWFSSCKRIVETTDGQT